jgi:hypothetical protein
MQIVAQIEDEVRLKSEVRNTVAPTLAIPLGFWLPQFSTGWEVQWATGTLYDTKNKIARILRPGRNTRSGPSFFDMPHAYNQLPYGTQPARVRSDQGMCTLVGWGTRLSATSQEAEPSNRQHFRNSTDGLQWLWQNVDWNDDGEIILNAIGARKAIAVSDGTLKDGKGAASAVIEGQNKIGRISLSALTSGEQDQQSSFRSELTGILMIVSVVSEMCKRAQLTGGKITVGCDGKAAVQAAARHKEPIDPNGKQIDLIAAIRNLVRESKIDWRFKHVKGHTSVRPFTRQSDLNDEMDTKCKDFLQDRDPVPHSIASIPNEPASIWIGSRKIVSNLAMELNRHLQETRAEAYWKGKAQSPEAKFDWEPFAKAINTIGRAKRVWLAKQSSSFCGVGKMMVRMGKWDEDICPRCKEPEPASHIWTCQDPMVESTWRIWEQETHSIATKMESPTILTDAMIEAVQAWRKGDEDLIHTDYDNIRKAFEEQSKIGWQGFMEGRWASEWRVVYDDMGGKKNPCQWAAKMIVANWDQGRRLWDQRNEQAHKKESTKAWETLDKEIREMKETPIPRMDEQTKEWFQTDLETILEWEPNRKRDWLNRMQAARRAHNRRAQTTPMERMRRNMAAFLNRQPRGTN